MWVNVGLCPHGLQHDLKWGDAAATSDHSTCVSHDMNGAVVVRTVGSLGRGSRALSPVWVTGNNRAVSV